MPQVIRCPHCQGAMRVPDTAGGRTVRCVACKQTFTLPGAGPRLATAETITTPPRPPAGKPSTVSQAPAATVSAAAPQCPACGTVLPRAAISCMECGYLVHGAGPVPPTPEPEPLPVAIPVTPFEDLAAPAAVPVRARRLSPLVHVLPACVLLLALLGVVLKDYSLRGTGGVGEGDAGTLVELPIDPDPLVLLRFDDDLRFGLSMAKEKDPTGEPKKLTYSEKGSTNNTCLRVDWDKVDNDRHLGFRPGRWKDRDLPLGKDASGRERLGRKSTWLYEEELIVVTQVVEIVAGEQVSPGATKRHLDTCVVRYLIENKDDRPHRVGLRFLLDTFIGVNDGVPFTIPGVAALCDTRREFPLPDEVPDFIQALERSDLQDPGTVAHLTLRLGGKVEPPGRVLLTHWKNTVDWEVPLTNIERDSAVVLYWREKELKPGGTRELGFAYGLGNVSSAEGGKLGVTLGGSFKPGDEFTVTAYVNNPVPGQTLTLQLPAGLELVKGGAEQQVPALPAGATSRNSPVTWKVRAGRVGRYTLQVQSNTGVAQSQSVTIKTSSGIFD